MKCYHIQCGTCKKDCIVPLKSLACLFWIRHMWKWHDVYIYVNGRDGRGGYMNILELIDEFHADRNKQKDRHKLDVYEKVAIREAFEWVVDHYEVRRKHEAVNKKL